MTTWATVAKRTSTTVLDEINILALQTNGEFSSGITADFANGIEDTTAYTITEYLAGKQSRGHLLDLIGFWSYVAVDKEATTWTSTDKNTDAEWAAIEAATTSWTDVVQSGTVAAQFELNEPLGGPIWTSVDKDEIS